ncbi:MAG: FecR domain-containing protein [Treponemataceae bacterium]
MKYFRKSDIIVIIVIALIEIFLITLYFMLGAFNLKSRGVIGIVHFKKNIATRRQTDVFHWQGIKSGSTLYEYDTLRTAGSSDATIEFFDGTTTELHLSENSLIKLGGLKSSQLVELESGEINISSALATGAKGKTISIGGKTLEFSEDTNLVISTSEDGDTNIEVMTGEAKLFDDEKEISLNSLQQIKLSSTGELGEVKKLPVALLSPKGGKKLIALGDNAKVPFSFVAENSENVKLLVSDTPNFENVHQVIENFSKTDVENVYTCETDAFAEKIYWKLVLNDGTESKVQTINVEKVSSLAEIKPRAVSSVVQTGDNPNVKFNWDKIEGASSYTFELSKHSDFRTIEAKKVLENTSTQISDLDAGEYFWRITPNYEFEVIGEAENITNRLVVQKTDELLAIKTIFPANNYKLKIASIAEKEFNFSWLPNKLASEYILSFYDANSILVEDFTVKTPSVSLNSLDTKMFDDIGQMFWSVSYKTSDGRKSPESSKCILNKTDDISSFRTIFPKNNYAVLTNLMPNIRFTWENESKFETVFAIAKDSNFSSFVLEKKSDSTSFLGAHLENGKYFWRVQLVDKSGNVQATSEVKSFDVISNLDAVVINEPKKDEVVPLLKEVVVKLNWDEVEHADYYELAIYGPNGKRIIYLPFAETRTMQIPVGDYPEGEYTIKVQACSYDTLKHTKNTGLVTTTKFSLKEIEFIRLIFPENVAQISGADAHNEGVDFKWFADNTINNIVLQVSKDDKIIRSVPVNKSGEVFLNLKDLSAGKYSWQVLGNFAGYSVTSKTPNNFTILPVPPIPVPKFLSSKQTPLIDMQYLKEKRSLYFEWSPSKYANYYIFAIVDNQGQTIFNKKITETKFEFNDLQLLSSGEFTANVKAVSTSLLRGKTLESDTDNFSFAVDLPKILKPESIIQNEAEYYGF